MVYPKWRSNKNTGAIGNLVDKMFSKAFTQNGEPTDAISKYSWKLMHHTFKPDDSHTCSWYPAAHFSMTGDAIRIIAELPGVNREDVYVGVKNNVLTLNAERSVEEILRDEDDSRQQRCASSFRRAFILPETVEPAHIKAEFSGGILNVEIFRTKK